MPRRPRSRRPRLSPRFAEGVLWATVFFCPLALGTFQGLPVLGMLCLATAGLLALAAATERISLPAAGLVLAALALVTGLSALPLPPGLLRLLSPQGAETYAFGLGGLAAPGWRPLTLDGPGTARELCKTLAYAAAFLTAYELAGSRRTRRRLASALALAGLALALLGYGHLLANAHDLFGLTLFKESHPPFVTTFGNKNNAAGFFSLCAPVALGLALRGRDRRAQALWALAYVLMGAAVFLCLSRGGISAFLVAQLALGGLLLSSRERERAGGPEKARRSPRAAVATICAAAVAVSIAAFLGYDSIAARLSTLDSVESVRQEGKLRGFGQALAILRDFPLTGLGRGAFPTVSGHYLTIAEGTAEYIENEPLQALADFGLPVGAALLLFFLWTFGRALLSPRLGPLDYGLAAGLLALALQNLVDFSLELGGVALPALVALALLCRGSEAEGAVGRRAPRGLVVAGALAAALWGGLAFPLSLRDWRSEGDAFAAEAPALDAAHAEAAALPLLGRHPASFVLPLALAERWLSEGKPAHALHWLNRALYFKPNVAAMHLVALGALADLGKKEQALLEARLYFAQDPGSAQGLSAVAARYPGLSDLEAALPRTEAGYAALIAFLAGRGRSQDALAAARRGVAAVPDAAPLRCRLAELLVAAGRADEAVAEAEGARALAPDGPAAYLALSAALAAAGKLDPAEEALQDGLRHRPGDPDLVFARVDLDLSRNRPMQAEKELELLGTATTLDQRARALEEVARIYGAEGRTAKAEEALRAAARLQPGYGWELAGFLEGQSRYAQAIPLLQELAAGAEGAAKADADRRIAADRKKVAELENARRAALLLAPVAPPAP